MKNIHVLPTDKPSRIYNILGSKKIGFTSNDPFYTENCGGGTKNQNIYITSDKEISGFENNIWVIKGDRIFLWQNTMALVSNNKPRKIILTTDQDLINDGVQEINYEFLEWFVNNPGFEKIEVIKTHLCTQTGLPCGMQCLNEETCNENITYKIIIPKKEPKCLYDTPRSCENSECRVLNKCNGDRVKSKQETLEEAKIKIYKDYWNFEHTQWIKSSFFNGFEAGAKWQAEKMYSEEGLKNAFDSAREFNSLDGVVDVHIVLSMGGDVSDLQPLYFTFEEWFEQFKKK